VRRIGEITGASYLPAVRQNKKRETKMPTFAFTTIDVTGATATSISGINASGQIIGNVILGGQAIFSAAAGVVTIINVRNDAFGPAITGINARGEVVGFSQIISPAGVLVSQGFSEIPGVGTIPVIIDVPNATSTQIFGVNDAGEIVGTYRVGRLAHGFADIDGVFTTIDPAGSTSSTGVGISDSGEIVGNYTTLGSTSSHGFAYVNGTFTTIDPAGSVSTSIKGITNSGEIFGDYNAGGKNHGFVDINGTITTIDVAGSTGTSVIAVNNNGEIVGAYSDSSFKTHGFVDIDGVITTIDVPGASFASITGINDSGVIVGTYDDAAGGHGFEATPGARPIISGAQSSQATTDARAITPFLGVVIAAPATGAPTETVAITPDASANGTLSDPNAISDASTINNGVFTITGDAAAVTKALQGLVFTPADHQVAPGQSVTTEFAIKVANPLGQLTLSESDDTTSVVATALNDPPTLISPVLSYTVGEGQTLQNLYQQLLANAQDIDFGEQAQLTLSTLGLSNTAGFLHFDPADQLLTYTADGFNAGKPVDSFAYTISDPEGAAVTGTVNVTVTGATLPTAVGSAGADRLTADGSGHRLIGGDGNDRLTGNGERELIFGGRGDDTITANGNNSVIDAGPGNNLITLNGNRETIVLQQGGVDQISGFQLHNGDVLDLSQMLAQAQINLAGDFSQLGSFVQVSSAGRDITLSFAGSPLAVLRGTGAGDTLDTLIQDGSLRIN
jgi:Cadherin-like domain/RTX calcium-binding nonapeptide repeat (4 copies)